VYRSFLSVLSPLFKYSDSREAWVLRGVGRWAGPALVPREWKVPPEKLPAEPAPFRPTSRRFERRQGAAASRVRSKQS
jgi:hypothetical protein